MARRIYCGINTDPANPSGNPTSDQLRALGADWVRFTFKDLEHGPQPTAFGKYDVLVQQLRSAGIRILMILSYETYPDRPASDADETQWDTYIQKFADRCRQIAQHYGAQVNAYEIWNEPDLEKDPFNPNYKPYVREPIFARLMRAAYRSIQSVSPATVVLGGLVAGQPQYLANVQTAMGGKLYADAVGVHPYGRRPTDNWPNPTWGVGALAGLLQQYHGVAKKPLWITEMGCDDVAVQAQFLGRTFESVNANLAAIVPAVFWFCWSDGMVEPFGLLDKSGAKKLAYDSFRAFAVQPYAGEVVSTAITGLKEKLLQQAEVQQKIQFNRGAALQMRIVADGFVPNSGEFDVPFGEATYRGQRAEHLGSGEVRVYYCKVPLWGDIRFVSPASTVAPQAEVIDLPSAHQHSREGHKPSYIIVHTTESPVGAPAENTARYLVSNERGVSAHELVMPGGKVYRMVPDDRLAHHARWETVHFPDGTSWTLANHITWGIEGYQIAGRPVSQEVLALMKARVAAACKRLNLDHTRVLGHREIDPPPRKWDPVGADMDEFRASVERLLLPDPLFTAATQHQVIHFNPTAALQRQIFADGFAPNSDEFDVSFEGATYRAQRAEHLTTGKVRVYYCMVPDWANVRFVERV